MWRTGYGTKTTAKSWPDGQLFCFGGYRAGDVWVC